MNYAIKGRAMGRGMNSETEKRILDKKNMHISIGEQIITNKNKTPNKSYIYRMNTSFSKEGSSGKNGTSPTSDGSLPTISNTHISADQESSTIIKKKGGKGYIAQNYLFSKI